MTLRMSRIKDENLIPAIAFMGFLCLVFSICAWGEMGVAMFGVSK